MADGDSKAKTNKTNKRKLSADGGYVFQPVWLRRGIRCGNEIDRFLLDYGCHFLLPVGITLWIVFLLS